MPKLVNSSQLSVHSEKNTVNSEPITVNRKSAGFTLIELLIVMTIIAILLAAGTFAWTNAQQKGRDGKRKSDLKAIQQALESYYQTNGNYPASIDNSANLNWAVLSPLLVTGGFISQIPKDPVNNSPLLYYYDPILTGVFARTYTLSATLENTNDPDLNGLPCTPHTPPANYCVKNP